MYGVTSHVRHTMFMPTFPFSTTKQLPEANNIIYRYKPLIYLYSREG